MHGSIIRGLFFAFTGCAFAFISGCQKDDTPIKKDHVILAGDSASAGIYHGNINKTLKGASDTCNVDIDKSHVADFAIQLISKSDSSGQGFYLSAVPISTNAGPYFYADASGNPMALFLNGVIADSVRWVNGSSSYILSYISEQTVSGKQVYSSLGNWVGKPDAYLGFKIVDNTSGYTYLGWLQIVSGNVVKDYGYMRY